MKLKRCWQAQEKMAANQKVAAKLTKDKEFYKNSALPDDLKESLRRNDSAIKADQANIDLKKKEIEDIKSRFEADRIRLRELRSDKSAQ